MLFSQMEFFRGRGNRLCGGDQRAMKTDEVCDRPLDPFGYCSAMRAEMQAEEKNPRKNGKEIQKSVNEKARSNVYISENKWKEVRRWMRARFRRKR